jgi:Apea-like HEPN
MHSETKALLKDAILQCLPIIHPIVGRYEVPHQVWTKKGDGLWHSEIVPRPDLVRVFIAADEQFREASLPFAKSFLAHHPEYMGMVGFPRFGRINLGHDVTYIFRAAIGHLWRKYGQFKIDELAVNTLVNEFEAFVDKPTVRFHFRSQLLNFNTPGDLIELPEGLRVRRMNDSEVSAFHGGSMQALGMIRSSAFGLHEFCIEGETEEPKAFGNLKDDVQPAKDHVKASLDKAILSLRTFKGGYVGYDFVHFYPCAFCPLPQSSYGFGDSYVPIGDYKLNVEEFGHLAKHAKMVFASSEPSMEMACSRLADAETRTKPQDRLVDAVIGMESLLLAGLGKEDRKGELKFRFSLHYSTLFETPEERHRAYRLAKHLYDLRSMVAHGSVLDDRMFPIGDEKLKLPEAAKRATETLRYLVRHFLPLTNQAPYRKHDFWERAYFGLPDVRHTEPTAARDRDT